MEGKKMSLKKAEQAIRASWISLLCACMLSGNGMYAVRAEETDGNTEEPAAETITETVTEEGTETNAEPAAEESAAPEETAETSEEVIVPAQEETIPEETAKPEETEQAMPEESEPVKQEEARPAEQQEAVPAESAEPEVIEGTEVSEGGMEVAETPELTESSEAVSETEEEPAEAAEEEEIEIDPSAIVEAAKATEIKNPSTTKENASSLAYHAMTLNLNVEDSYYIHTVKDSDNYETKSYWFKFTTRNEDAYYYLECQNNSVDGNAEAKILTPQEGEIARMSYISQNTKGSRSLRLDKNATYYIKLTVPRNKTGIIQFWLAYTPDKEPDDMMNKAAVPSVNLGTRFSGSLDGPGDIDYFKIKTGRSGHYSINVRRSEKAAASTGDVHCTILDEYEHRVISGTSLDTVRYTDLDLQPDSTYYIKIYNSDYQQNVTPYDVNLQVDPVMQYVERLYEECLGRTADSKGAENWYTQLKKSQSNATQVALGFFRSREFLRKFPMDRHSQNAAQFVDICYRVFMNRKGDAAGVENWKKVYTEQMDMDVIRGFVDSSEFINICRNYGVEKGTIKDPTGLDGFIARCYNKALCRDYDEGGLKNWHNIINNGSASNKKEWGNTAKERAINVASRGFFNSQEFLNRKTSNEVYVKTLYRTFLGRESDPTGMSNWLGKLNSGKMNRGQVLMGFAGSQEFLGILRSYGIY